VAKALIKRLKDTNDPLLNKIDTLILVDVPQVGTPQALGAALHGYDQALPKEIFPILLNSATARAFASNSPMAHHLLPSAAYFSSDGITVRTPPITFDDGAVTQNFVTAYGHAIGNSTELHDFLLGAEGRPQADFDDDQNPSKLSTGLLSYSESQHTALDNGSLIPSNISVHQIGGWGNDTLASIRYYTGYECVRTLPSSNCQISPVLQYDPDTVIDGDGTVITASSLALSTSSVNVTRWWVDLGLYNSDNPSGDLIGLQLDHKNILELNDVRSHIKGILGLSSIPNSTYVKAQQPRTVSGTRLIFKLHSPLDLIVIDQNGRRVTSAELSIPGGIFKKFGEVQYISVPASANPTVHLDGYAEGSFTLNIEQENSGETVASTTFAAIPTNPNTTATISFPDGTVSGATVLSVDQNGDNVPDQTFAPKLKGIVLPDTIAPEAIITVSTSSKDILVTGIDETSTTTVTKTGTTTTVTDGSGNKTTLFFQKQYSGSLLSYARLTGISYGTSAIALPSSFLYVWDSTKTPVSQTVVADKQFVIQAVYNKKTDKTTIIVLKKNVPIQTTTLTGLRLVKLTTSNGSVGYSW
jgi:hypothetical protein